MSDIFSKSGVHSFGYDGDTIFRPGLLISIINANVITILFYILS